MNAQRYDQEVHFPKSGKSTQNPPPKWLLTTSLIISQIIGFRAMVIRDGNDLLISPNNTYYSTFDLYLFSSEIARGSVIGYIVQNRGHYCTPQWRKCGKVPRDGEWNKGQTRMKCQSLAFHLFAVINLTNRIRMNMFGLEKPTLALLLLQEKETVAVQDYNNNNTRVHRKVRLVYTT